jgi:hypothetical protein
MITLDDLRALLNTQPFVPFRLWLSDGGFVDVPSREFVMAGKRFAIIGLLDANATDMVFDRYTPVWYSHVRRHEMLNPGTPPFTPPSPGSASPAQA